MGKRNIGKFILVFLLLCISLGLILYPFISNYMFENRADGIIETVEKAADNTGEEERLEELDKAADYNSVIATGHIQLKDPFVEDQLMEDAEEYNSLLCMTDDGVMGFIEIPCINVSLPIYHGTSEQVLEIGAGHLQGTSLPIGGESTHSVITGHTGLSSAKLFTDLTELVEGDVFFLQVMGEKLAYEVDQISKVLPSEMDKLSIETGKDYCTLVTCTPYGVNSHRLLVRGFRTDYKDASENPEVFKAKATESKWMEEYTKSILVSSVVFIVLVILLIIWRIMQSRKRKRNMKKKKKKKKKKKSGSKSTGESPKPKKKKVVRIEQEENGDG